MNNLERQQLENNLDIAYIKKERKIEEVDDLLQQLQKIDDSLLELSYQLSSQGNQEAQQISNQIQLDQINFRQLVGKRIDQLEEGYHQEKRRINHLLNGE